MRHDDSRRDDDRHPDVPAARVPRHDQPSPARRGRHGADHTAASPGDRSWFGSAADPGVPAPGYGPPPGAGSRGRLGDPDRYGPSDAGHRTPRGPAGPVPPPVGMGPAGGSARAGGYGPGPAGPDPRHGGPGPYGPDPRHGGPGPYGPDPGGPGPYGPAGPGRYGSDYDGDRTSGLYGGGYGGEPGSAAAARRALQGDSELIAGMPGGPNEPPGPPTGGGGGRGGGGGGRRRRGPRLRKAMKIAGLATAILLVLGIATVGLLYARTDVPDPNALETNQIATIYYGDGKTTLARIGSQNRTDVPLTRVPAHVRYAVLAAENRSFYTDPGISPKGITRAALNNLRGGDLQGGSTITQQYVKNVFTSGDRTFDRKFKELFVTVKLDRQYSKDQILEWYLNTIYFGRGAYGIQAAAQVYFGRSVNQLTVAQGAVLASSIRSPALYDPQAHPEAAKDRWAFVLNGMVTMGKLSAADKAKQKYPPVRKKTTGTLDDVKKTWAGHVVDQVLEELGTVGFDQARLNQEGLRVVTTIDPKAQAAAINSVRAVFATEQGGNSDTKLRQALVSINPQNGNVLAYYGGANGLATDYAQSWRQAGSAFKPYVLATALQQTLDPETPDDKKISVFKTYDGSSPQDFNGTTVRNSDGAQCNPCSVMDAMRRSINTVFYRMALDAGPANVAATAHKMGIVATREVSEKKVPTLAQPDGTVATGIAIGQYEVRTIDQAQGFATLASGGTLHPAHFVSKVLDRNGKTVWSHEDKPQQVIDSKVANDVTYSMKPVAAASEDPLADGRESAAKTGTQQFLKTDGNSDAWMVGFTPKASTAVWVGTNKPMAIKDSNGRNIYGRGLPGRTWQSFMDAYLAGTPKDELTDQVQVNPWLRPAPPVTQAPAPTTEASTPTAQPTRPKKTKPRPKPTPSPTDTPVPTPSGTVPIPTPTGSGIPKPSPTKTRPGGP